MKRVLQVVGKMNIGGAETLLMNVYRNIDRNKVQFDFLTFYGGDEKGFFDEEIQSLGGRIINIEKPSHSNWRRNIHLVQQALRETPYEVVHTHLGSASVFSLMAAKREDVPIRIAHSHNTDTTHRSISRCVYDLQCNWLINHNLTKCAACSLQAAKCRFSKINLQYNYQFVGNGEDFSRYFIEYDNTGIRDEMGIFQDELFILQVGNFCPQKNQLYTLNLVKHLTNSDLKYRIVFAGNDNGEYAMTCKNKCNRDNLHEHLLFLGSRRDIPELMSAADVLIMPSQWEGLGMVLIEAQASGLPCIVSDAIQPEADLHLGLVQKIPLRDINNWAAAICKSKRSKRIDCGTRRIAIQSSAFSLDKTIEAFEKLYEI